MSEVTRVIFSGMQILMDEHWVADKAIVVEGQKIKAILDAEMIKHHLPARHFVFARDDYLIPGLIDLHIHGANGHDVMDASEIALKGISRALAAEGVTGYLATTMTASVERIEAALAVVRASVSHQDGAMILGVHLEGPFIATAKMGAQCGEHVELPNVALMQRLQEIAGGMIKVVTLAPELPGAVKLIEELQKMAVIASVGHTNATYAETCHAIAAGCTGATHLFNAMSGIHQREPGAALALLLAEQVTAELIVDGLHLHPAVVALAWQMKGKNKLLLVTDAMRAKCLGDGDYELGGKMVTVRANRAALADGTLAGSTLRMPQAIKNMAEFSACGLAAAVHMASHTPASVLGLLQHKGSIAVGKDADLVVLKANDLAVAVTMCEGRVVYEC